jgi:hypothetical protein
VPTPSPPSPSHVDVPPAVLVCRAAEFGLTRDRLRGVGWEPLSRGLYGRRGVEQRPPLELARALTQVLPRDSGYAHLTSACLRRWWLPNRLGSHVMMASTTSCVHVQRRDLYVRRSRFAEFETIDGVPVSTPAQTLIELARDLSLVDLVAMVDCALQRGADRGAIREAARPRLRGAGRLRLAVELADPRSESWWETILRLLHVLPGLGPVESQVPLWDDGLFIARADLHLVGTSRFPECDGGRHREKERLASDLRREKGMARGRFQRYGYTTGEITNSPEMIIRDAKDARGWDHDPGRLRTWRSHTSTSTLTPYGRTLLAARLERYRLAADRHRGPQGPAA